MSTVDQGYLNYGRALRLGAAKYRDHIALEFEGQRYTFHELNAQVNAMAQALSAAGARRGERLLVLSANSPDYVRLLFAAAKLGVVCVPASTALTAADLGRIIRAAEPALVVSSEHYRPTAEATLAQVGSTGGLLGLSVDSVHSRPDSRAGAILDAGTGADAEPSGPPPSDDQPAILLFTSGSMGTPKAVIKSYANLSWHAINRQLAEPRRELGRELFVLPITGVGFGNFIVTDIMVGATCVLEPSFDPERAAVLMSEASIQYAFLAPTMMMAIAARAPGQVFDTVEVIETAYEITPQQRRQVAAMFPRARIQYSYGCTEGSMGRAPAEAFLTDPSCVGFASGLDEYRIVGPSEAHDSPDHLGPIEVAGPTVMQGYLGADGTVSEDVRDGWFDMGDLGWIDDREQLHFGGRKKDMIKSGAMNVYAGDVESVLIEHPDVDGVAVIGIPDPYWGEAVVAVLQPRSGVTLELEGIRELARERLAGYRRPKGYYVTDQLPINATGKLAKGELRAQVLSHALTELVGPA